jgi:hypothetical protein
VRQMSEYVERGVPTAVRVVVVSSLARDIERFPSPASYVVEFDDTITNVVSIELVYALYEKLSTDRYVNLTVLEADGDLVSNCNTARRAFTQLPLVAPLNEYDGSKYRSVRTFTGAPLARLTRLTIAFVGPSGRPYPMRDHLLRFEVTSLAPGAREAAAGTRTGFELAVGGGGSGSGGGGYRVYRPRGAAATWPPHMEGVQSGRT